MNPSRIRFTFVHEEVSSYARLLWETAPQTCEAVVALLPFEGDAVHAIYSGSEIALDVPALGRRAMEHPTLDVFPGDVAYAYVPAEDHYGVASDLPEICWIYDHDARPGMFEGPVPIGVFARFEDLDDIAAVSRRMRVEGAKRVRVEVA